MAWAGARAGRSRRRRGCAAGRRRERARGSGADDRHPRSHAAVMPQRARRAALREELRVELERVRELLGQIEVGEDRVDRARLDARVAIDAHRRFDVELLGGLEVGGPRLRVDAVDRADLDARVVLDARADDDVGHEPEATRPRARASASRGAAAGLSASAAAARSAPCCSPSSPRPRRRCAPRSARSAKVERLAETLRRMGPTRSPAGVALPVGRAAPAPDRRRLGARCATCRAPAREPTLTVAEVDARVRAHRRAVRARARRRARRAALQRAVRARDGEPSRRFLRALLTRRAAPGRARGRDGRGGGAAPPGVPAEAVRARADAARRPRRGRGRRAAGGAPGLAAIGLRGRPAACSRCSPRPAPTSTAALERIGPAAVECKLDGARIQVHRAATTCASSRARSTTSPRACPRSSRRALALPRATARARRRGDRAAPRRAAAAVPGHRAAGSARAAARRASADAAVLRRAARRRRGRPRPARRRARRGARPRSCPAGARPARRRGRRASARARCSRTRSPAGHEGVLVKALDAPYAAGPPRRRLAEGQAASTRSTSSCSRPSGATAAGAAG